MKSLNNAELALLLDLLGKRPDLSVQQVESLHTSMQQKAQQEKKKTVIKQRKIWEHIIVSATIVSVALFGYWLSGAPFERGGPLTVLFIVTVGALIGVNAIAASDD